MIHNKRMLNVTWKYGFGFLGGSILLLVACSAPVQRKMLIGVIENGVYLSPSKGFAVEAPVFRGVDIRDGVEKGLEWVDFQVGCCNWMESGGYSLEWITVGTPAKNFGAFVDKADLLIRGNIKRSIDPDTSFVTLKQRTLAINSKPAKQVLGRIRKDNMDAFYAATVINYGDRYALGILMFRIDEGNMRDYRRVMEWKRYVRFIQSIRKIKTPEQPGALKKPATGFSFGNLRWV